MASSSSYLLPGPTPSSLTSIGSKSALMKSSLPPPVPLSSPYHSLHHMSHPPLPPQSYFRSSMPGNPHPHMTRNTPVGDSSHPLTVTTANPSSLALSSMNNSDENNGGGGGSSGSGGHSLSQSMESINNIGLTDDEVGNNKCSFRADRYHSLSHKTKIATWHRSISNRSVLFVDLLVCSVLSQPSHRYMTQFWSIQQHNNRIILRLKSRSLLSIVVPFNCLGSSDIVRAFFFARGSSNLVSLHFRVIDVLINQSSSSSSLLLFVRLNNQLRRIKNRNDRCR